MNVIALSCISIFMLLFRTSFDLENNPSELLSLQESLSCTKNETLPNGWCMDVNNLPRYVGLGSVNEFNTTTEVRHYTHEGYSKCLANKTVVFIGDSRVRYQYMHLSSYLKSRRMMTCNDRSLYQSKKKPVDAECYLIDHEHHVVNMGNEDWMSWYNESTAMLNDAQQTSICDCFRSTPFDPRHTYENRFTKRRTPYGDINLIYLQNFQNSIKINADFPPSSPLDMSPETERCLSGHCGTKERVNAFDGDLNAALWRILPMLNTTHAFINLGWKHLFPFNQQSELSCVMQEYNKQHSDMELFLISHPPTRTSITNPAFMKEKLKCDIDVLDRSILSKNVPTSWYWDNLHVLSILNEEYNHQLVEKICPL